MYMNPKVSIVIPCYGVEKYISNIFDDLKKQNFKDNMEFIFVNDGGSNTLEDIIVDYIKNNKDVRDRYSKYLMEVQNYGI